MDNKIDDKWTQGFICAVCVLIQMEGCVNTQIMELYKVGSSNKSIKQLELIGIDVSDLDVIKRYWNQLHNISEK